MAIGKKTYIDEHICWSKLCDKCIALYHDHMLQYLCNLLYIQCNLEQYKPFGNLYLSNV